MAYAINTISKTYYPVYNFTGLDIDVNTNAAGNFTLQMSESGSAGTFQDIDIIPLVSGNQTIRTNQTVPNMKANYYRFKDSNGVLTASATI